MVATSANITVGHPSTVIVSAYGAAEGAGVDLGSSEGGVKLTPAIEHYWHKADQWTGKVGATKTDEDLIGEIILAEATQENLTYATGYPTTAAAGGTFDFGGNSTVTLRTVYINGPGPGGSTRKITLHKVVFTGNTEYIMLKNDKTGLKVEMQVLQDTSKAANKQYYSCVDAGGDTTPPTVAMDVPAEDGTVTKGTSDTVTLQFTEAGSAIDEGSLVYLQSVIVTDLNDPTQTIIVAGSFVYSAATLKLTFTPTAVWDAAGSHEYVIMVTTACRDTAGNHLAAVFYGHFTSTV